MPKKPEIVELAPFACDDLHFDARVVDGYNKTWNFVVCEREAGKSTLMWKKIYNEFKKTGNPSIVLRRQIVDITPQYIDDTATLLQKFTHQNVVLDYTKGDIKNGQMDVRLNGKVFFRLIALSAPMSRLKSMVLPNVKFMMFDEFICNRRIGEKYLADEPFRIKEIFTTYNRETKGIKFYAFGNPYSLYNPYFSWLKVPTNDLYPGALISKDDYVVHCYQIKDELRAAILAHNPLYQFDDTYKTYAFDGRAVYDANIRIYEDQPQGFRLAYCFKLNNKILGVYNGYNEAEQLFYWCRTLNEAELSKRREIVCFDFGQMANRTVLQSNNGTKLYMWLKQSIERRMVGFADVEASYMLEEIYQEI